MGVPAADFFKDRTAEKHGYSRKRNDKAQAHETRQRPSKPRGIVDSKAASEPCVAGVIKIEDPLQTGKFGARGGKSFGDRAQLLGGGASSVSSAPMI